MDKIRLQSAYILTGTNIQYKNDFIQKIKNELFPNGSVNNSFIEINSDELDEKDLILQLRCPPFFNDYRLFIIKACNNIPSSSLDAIAVYLEDPSPTSILIMVFDKIDKRLNFYKKLTKINPNFIIENDNVDDKKLSNRIKEIALNHQISLSDKAAKEIGLRLGNDEQKITNAIILLSQTYDESKDISLSQVKEIITQQANPKYWELSDAISKKDLTYALKIFDILSTNNTDLGFVFGLITMISNRLIKIMTVKGLLKQQEDLHSIALKIKVQDWQVNQFCKFAKNFTYPQLKDALKALLEIEYSFKTSPINLLVFEQFIIKTCS